MHRRASDNAVRHRCARAAPRTCRSLPVHAEPAVKLAQRNITARSRKTRHRVHRRGQLRVAQREHRIGRLGSHAHHNGVSGVAVVVETI